MKGTKMKRGRKSRVNKLLVALIAVMMVAVYGLAPIQAVTGVAFAEETWYTMDADGNVVVKDGTTTIDTTLQCESEVTTVTIPASVTEVEDYAFFGCENLTVVTFKAETPPSIGSCAFESQGDAVTVNVPKGCKDEYESALVENYAFTMTDYTVVEAGGGTDPVDPDPTPSEKQLFTYSAVEGGVAITGTGKDFALSSENRVETITVPDTIGGQPVVGIASGAFKEKFVGALYGGSNSGVRVITVKLPETVQYIDDDAFSGCQGLAAVNMPRDLKRIGERAFYNCKNLVNAEFPAGLEMIEYGAFWNCFALKGNADGIIALPEGAKVQLTGAGHNQDSAFSMCSSVQGYDISNDEFKTDKDGVIFTADGKTLVQYPLGRTSSSYDIPEGTETIGQNAFKWHQSDTKNPNNLKSLTFPESITETKACAFSNCRNLESIEVKNLKKDFKRSEFDCYAINLDGDYSKYGYWVEGVFYLYDDATISDIAGNQDNSGGAIGDLEKVNTEGEKFDAAASGATLVTADAGSIDVLCGCSVGGGGQFAATANPKFNYKTASSNTATSGGSAAGNAAKAAGGNGGSPVTGDEASLLIFALLAMVSGTYIFARRQRVK